MAGVVLRVARSAGIVVLFGEGAPEDRQLRGDSSPFCSTHAVRYRRNQALLMRVPPSVPEAAAPDTPAVRRIIAGALAEGREWLNEAEAKQAHDAASAAQTPAPTPRGGAAQAQDSAGGRGAPRIRPYNSVVTSQAETVRGMFVVHRVNDRLLFEIPRDELGKENRSASGRNRREPVRIPGANESRAPREWRQELMEAARAEVAVQAAGALELVVADQGDLAASEVETAHAVRLAGDEEAVVHGVAALRDDLVGEALGQVEQAVRVADERTVTVDFVDVGLFRRHRLGVDVAGQAGEGEGGGRAGEASTGEPGSMGTEDPGAPETPSGESGTPPGSTAAEGTGP